MALLRPGRIPWQSGVGGLCLAAMLVLWSPGVQIARAEGAAPPLLQGGLPLGSAGGSCEVGAEKGPDVAAQMAQVLEALEAQAAADGEDVTVFNGTGSNYRRDDDALAELHRIRAEVKREQQAAKP